jgi:hypothetical protein
MANLIGTRGIRKNTAKFHGFLSFLRIVTDTCESLLRLILHPKCAGFCTTFCCLCEMIVRHLQVML